MENANLYSNLPYLFLAYGAAWGALALYLARLGKKQRALDERLREMEKGSGKG